LSSQSSSSFAVGDELSVAVAPALNSSQREHLEELTVLASKVGGPKDMVVPVAQMGVLPTLEPTSCSKDYMLCDLKEIHRETVLSVEKIFSPIEGAGENPHGSSCENLEAFCEDETLQLRLKMEVSSEQNLATVPPYCPPEQQQSSSVSDEQWVNVLSDSVLRLPSSEIVSVAEGGRKSRDSILLTNSSHDVTQDCNISSAQQFQVGCYDEECSLPGRAAPCCEVFTRCERQSSAGILGISIYRECQHNNSKGPSFPENLATKRQDANKGRPRSRSLPGHNLEINNKYKTVFENYVRLCQL
jgi:hypothetical protein